MQGINGGYIELFEHCVLSNKGLEINAKCPHEGVIVPKALHRADSSGMRSAERRKVNVIELKYLRSLV